MTDEDRSTKARNTSIVSLLISALQAIIIVLLGSLISLSKSVVEQQGEQSRALAVLQSQVADLREGGVYTPDDARRDLGHLQGQVDELKGRVRRLEKGER